MKPFLLVGLLLVLFPANLRASGPVVVVFDLETQGIFFPADLRSQLTDYLASLLAERGFQVVPRSQLRERLQQKKRESHRPCYDESCRIELGRELAARQTVVTRVLGLGESCKLSLTLMDLKTAASRAAVNLEGGCRPKDLVDSMERAVAKMAGRKLAPVEQPVLPGLQPLPDEKGPAIRTDLDPDLLVAYENALERDRQASEKPRRAKDAWSLLAGMPDPNPYREIARQRSQELQAYLKRRAAYQNQLADDDRKLAKLLRLKLIGYDEKVRLVDQYLVRYHKTVDPDHLRAMLNQAPGDQAARLSERFLERDLLEAMCSQGNRRACELVADHRRGWYVSAGLSYLFSNPDNSEKAGLVDFQLGYRWSFVRLLAQGGYAALPFDQSGKGSSFTALGALDLVLDAHSYELFLRAGSGWANLASEADGWSNHLVGHLAVGYQMTAPRSLGLGFGFITGLYFGTGDYYAVHMGCILSYALGI